jgi:alanyl-tRNA synthetase
MRPYTDEDISNEKSVPGPQIVPGTRELPLEEFVLIPGNEFSKSRTIFAGGTSLNVADTTRTGRVLGLDVLEDLIFSHDVGLSWDGKFDLSTIYVVDGVRAEIRTPYCEKFCEKAKFNDYFSYICNIVELFKIEGVGLPAFFTQLVRLLSDPPHRPSGCNIAQLEGYRRRLHGFWDCVLTTLALRSSSARSGLFNGIQRIRRSAPLTVRSKLREILASAQLEDDWRKPIAETGHPVLKKVLGYIPGDGSDEEAKEKEPEDKKFGFFTPDSSEEAKEKEPEDQKFGLFTRDADSLSDFPR